MTPPDLPTIGLALLADEGHAVLVCGDAAYRLTPSALSTLRALVEAATPTPMRRELAAALKLTCERALSALSAPLEPPRAEPAPTTIPAAPVPLAPAQRLLPERDRPPPPTATGLTAEQLTTYRHHLTPEERCMVDAMRRDAGGHVGQVRDGADYLYLPPNRPVGRLPAMFSLIGRGICVYRDGDRYALVDAWRDPLPAVT